MSSRWHRATEIRAALVIVSQSFIDPKVVVMVVVVAIVSLLILMPLSRKLANSVSDDAKRSRCCNARKQEQMESIT